MVMRLTAQGQSKRKQELANTTIREFDGGLNIVDNDLNLDSRYSKTLENMYIGDDGSQQLRFGTRLFATFPFIDEIINCIYYANTIVVVGRNGHVGYSDSAGNVVEIWNDTIAGDLPGEPNGWSETEFVSFAIFKGELIIGNGVDKPLIVYSDLTCEYLHDPATGTNINVPVARYVINSDRYIVWVGNPLKPTMLHISNIDSSGVYYGDDPPNDAVDFDIGPWIDSGVYAITGATFFRDQLLIFTEETIIVITLGEYTPIDGEPDAHVPRVTDVIHYYGTVSHRTIQNISDDVLFADIVGVPSVKRSQFIEQIRTERASQLIDPAIQSRIDNLSTRAMQDDMFAVYNRRQGQYMLFIPDEPDEDDRTETIGFVFKKSSELKIQAWSEFRGWNWKSGCSSSQGRIFFSRMNKLYIYGSREDAIYADYIEDGDIGVPIRFDWELPWADFGRRSLIKATRYLAIDTRGNSPFTVDMFVDNIFREFAIAGGDEPVLTPALSMEFLGGDAPGYGIQPYGNLHYGGGRRTTQENLYAWTANGKLFKLRIHGETRDPLAIVSISIDYLVGNIRR